MPSWFCLALKYDALLRKCNVYQGCPSSLAIVRMITNPLMRWTTNLSLIITVKCLLLAIKCMGIWQQCKSGEQALGPIGPLIHVR
jgi:hypothetical protein